MRKNPATFISLLLLAALVGYVLYDYFSVPRHDWMLTYRAEHSEPYDNKIIHDLLRDISGDRFIAWKDSTFTERSLSTVPPHSNYIFIGDQQYLTPEETSFLLRFIAEGNNALVISSSPSYLLIDSLLFPRTEYGYYLNDMGEYDNETWRPMASFEDSTAELTLLQDFDSGLTRVNADVRFRWNTIPHYWRYYKDSLYTREGWMADPLGTLTTTQGTRLNFIRFPVGNGQLFLHATPVVFTNYHMLSEKASVYAQQVFSVLGDGAVYWDDYNHKPDPLVQSGNNDEQTVFDDEPTQGPLIFILRQPGLRTAWFLILITAALYLFFGGRRKQRAIPVEIPLSNTSVEYAETIAQLFMKESDHKKLVILKMDLFRAFLRERFGIRTPLKFSDENDHFYHHVAGVTHTPVDLVSDIFEKFKYLSSIDSVTTEAMLAFYNQMENFYLTCK
jgi:hypothetical protein